MSLETMDALGIGRLSHVHRIFQVKTAPLPDDALVFRRMTGTEQLGRMFEYEIEMLSEDGNIGLASVLGEQFVVTAEAQNLGQEDATPRYYSGYASRFGQVGTLGRYWVYRATLRPWLWFLTRSAKCRIFEKMSVPDIVQNIFREHGFSDFRLALTGTHQSWDYRVQYRETDFNFVSRLLEEEGIYYYFDHTSVSHNLVLIDSMSSHPTVGSVPYFPPDEHGRREADHIAHWTITQEVQPGLYSMRDFNFAAPNWELQGKSGAPHARSNAHGASEFHDFTTELYSEGKEPKPRAEPSKLARVRIEEFQAQFEELHGAGDLAVINAGVSFKLKDFPREDQNREYVVTGCRFELVENEYETGISDDPNPPFTCSFTCIDITNQFRPQRITPKAVVQGPQTAIVVGGGEGGGGNDEIWTDQFGRVRVHFHWERDGVSSCWVRVAQVWAGRNWGAMAIPRIGQEVIVDFLEGDPDRPIVTGRVYNGEQVVPYPLPDEATKTTFKSNSSPGGGGFNEWRFEDKAGDEEIYIHAQKDMNTIVLNDKTENVGHDRSREVGHDESVIVGNDRQHEVGNNETVTIGKNQDITVGVDQMVTVGSNQDTSVGKTIVIKAGQAIRLECGGSSILLTPDGIVIKGTIIKVQGQIVNVRATSAKVDASKITLQGAAATIIQSALVKIN